MLFIAGSPGSTGGMHKGRGMKEGASTTNPEKAGNYSYGGISTPAGPPQDGDTPRDLRQIAS